MYTVDGVNIRNGMFGLAGNLTGLVYNAGMTVNYDIVYERDGYLWISYVSYNGATSIQTYYTAMVFII